LKNPVKKLLRKARVALSFPLHFFSCFIERRENVRAVILNLFEFRQEEKKESLVNLGGIPDVLLDDEVVADIALREDLNLLENGTCKERLDFWRDRQELIRRFPQSRQS